MTNKHDGFKMTGGGKQGGCFTCGDCGKKTRDTGNDEASAQLCLRCLNSNFLQNISFDGVWSEEERNEMEAIVAAARSGAITSKKMASELKRWSDIYSGDAQ